MKKTILMLLALVLAVMSVALPSGAEERPYRGLLVMGDSISTGYGLPGYKPADPYTCKSYANTIAERLGLSKGHGYLNKAVNGDTAADLLDEIKANKAAVAEADLIIISIGGNDLLGAVTEVATAVTGKPVGSLEEALTALTGVKIDPSSTQELMLKLNQIRTKTLDKFRADFKACTELLKTEAPNAKIIFLKQYNPFGSVAADPLVVSMVKSFVDGLNDELRAITTEKGYPLADVASVIDPKSAELTNMPLGDIHPNEAGHAVIADYLCEQYGLKLTEGSKPLPDDTFKAPETDDVTPPESGEATDASVTETPSTGVSTGDPNIDADPTLPIPDDDSAPSDGGCGSLISFASLAALLGCVWVSKKRK